jgi:hypothetical protein
VRSSAEVRSELEAVNSRRHELEVELRESLEVERSSVDRGDLNSCEGAWQPRLTVGGHEIRTCSFCGGLHSADFVFLMSREDTGFSGSDWKYGWPHKLYVNVPGKALLKFYTKHLKEANIPTFESANRLIRRYLDIEFTRIDGTLGWAASYHNIQLSGTTVALPKDFFETPMKSYFDMKGSV